MPKFLLSNLDYSEPNFRVYFAPVDVLIKDTVCVANQPLPEARSVLYLTANVDDYKHVFGNEDQKQDAFLSIKGENGLLTGLFDSRRVLKAQENFNNGGKSIGIKGDRPFWGYRSVR